MYLSDLFYQKFISQGTICGSANQTSSTVRSSRVGGLNVEGLAKEAASHKWVTVGPLA